MFSILKNIVIHNRIKLLGALFMILFLLFVYFVYKSISLDYLPIFSDEYGYYLDAKAFQVCNKLDAAFTINEYYSKIGNFSFHGFMYTLFYGTFFKLFALLGITPSIMLANMFLVFSLFVFLVFVKIEWEKIFFIGIVLLSNLIFLLFISSSMTEIFHLVFAVITGYLFYLIYKTKEKRYQYIFIVLALFLSIFRLSWIFILFGLFPLSSSIKDFMKYALILLFGLIFVVLTMQYFYASFPFGFMYDLMSSLHSSIPANTLNMLYEHFVSNVVKYFYSEGYFQNRYVFYYKYLFAALLIYSVYSSFKTRNNSIIAGTIVYLIFFINLFLLYDAYGWREVRVLAAPFMLMTVILILNNRYLPILFIILFQLLNMHSVLERKYENDWNRDGMHSRIEKNQVLFQNFMEFEKYIAPLKKKEILILLNRRVIPTEYSPTTYQLPLSLNGKCIKYSLIIGDENDFKIEDSTSDLMISDKPENRSNMKLIGKNKFFFFYQRIY